MAMVMSYDITIICAGVWGIQEALHRIAGPREEAESAAATRAGIAEVVHACEGHITTP
jgi:hypothetical protein